MSPSPLLGFVVGSSIAVLLPFFWSVSRMPDGFKNYSYATYTMIAPVYLGLMTALAVWLSRWWGLRAAVAAISVASPLIVVAFAYFTGSYNYGTAQEWGSYGAGIILKHMLVYNIVIYGLLTALSN